MAPAPAAKPAAPRKGLNLTQPGAKEYLIVGGSALGLALLYFWWKSRHAAAAAASSPSSSGSGTSSSTPTGLSTQELWHWISDHQSSRTTRTVHRDHHGGGHGGHGQQPKVTVPDVTGEKYMQAAKEIRARGLIAQRGTPFVGTVRRESPHESTHVRRGTVVTLSGRSGGGGTWPKPGRHHKKHHKHKRHHPAGK